MADHDSEARESKLESEVREMQLKEEDGDTDMDAIPEAGVGAAKQRSVSASGGDEPGGHDGDQFDAERASRSPTKSEGMDQSPAVKSDDEEVDVEVKLEAGTGKRKLTKSSHKVMRHAPALFSDYEDKTDEATSTFGVMTECSYANKYLGSTEHALECDCAEEWDSFTKTNQACGEDSDCINRATKMECLGDCGCGTACQNQRFLQKRYANVSVIKTEKKGYGLRANVDLKADDFIFEYIGEVIGENAFRKRMQNYDSEGIKHFYFMSLTKGEFVDATKRGNLGRFCNHSCAPNAYVDKWVVGDRLRMGIFAERKIQAGEEIVFNYNVDRYGADPQPCYCGEPNCTGFIGGKTQTERATKLSNTVIEALGIDDADSWDTAVAKKPKKKKVSEDDEEYVNNVEPRGLDEEGVNKVMSTLMQCKEKWIAVKLLTRIQRADDEKVRNRVVRFHGYRILKNVLSTFIDDVNVCLQVMEILEKMPRLTRNKIQDSKIEETVQELAKNEDERVSSKSLAMLQEWGKLELGYRIPRMKRDPNAVPSDRKTNRRDVDRRRSRSRTRSKSPDRMQAPTGPRNNAHQRAQPFPRPPPRFRPPMGGKLPPGWFEANAGNGSSYFYNSAGATTWQRPTMPAMGVPPPPPSKAVTDQQMLQDLIKNIVSTTNEPQRSASASGTPAETLKKEHKEEKWRSIPEDKRKKIYEGAIQPHIMHVVGKFKHKLEKEDLKRWAKELAKKIVESDFKNGRVQDPSKVGEKQIRNVKKHTLEFFQKATKKNEEAETRRAHRKSLKKEASNTTTTATSDANDVATPIDKDGADMGDVTLSDDEEDSPAALKRRRPSAADGEDDSDSLLKRQRTGTEEAPPPPPPPPPPVDMPDIETADADQPLPDTNGDAHSGNIARTDQALAGAEDGLAYKLASRPTSAHDDRFKADLTQTATPPTTGSPDHEQVEQEARKRNFAGMNPDRMRQLGLDGANGE